MIDVSIVSGKTYWHHVPRDMTHDEGQKYHGCGIFANKTKQTNKKQRSVFIHEETKVWRQTKNQGHCTK